MGFKYADTIKEVAEKGCFLGVGSSKQAYLLDGKVYKFAVLDDAFHSDQILFEKKVYEIIPAQLRDLLPKTTFVEVIEEHEGDSEEYLYSIAERIIPPNRKGVIALEEAWKKDFTIFDFIKIVFLIEQGREDLYHYYMELTTNFLSWLDKMGGISEDIVYNSENYGLNHQGELKILDWGA